MPEGSTQRAPYGDSMPTMPFSGAPLIEDPHATPTQISQIQPTRDHVTTVELQQADRNAQPRTFAGFMDLPKELRDDIWDRVWSGTKLSLEFLDKEMYIRYSTKQLQETSFSSLPRGLFANKFTLQEGLQQLQRCGEFVFEVSHTYPSNDSKPSSFLDPAMFKTLVLRSPLPEESFTLIYGQYPSHIPPAHIRNLHGLYERIKDEHVQTINHLINHLKAAGEDNYVQKLRIELNNAGDHKQHGLVLDPLFELGGCLPALREVSFRIEGHWIQYGNSLAPAKWFFAFGRAAKALLGVKKIEVETNTVIEQAPGERSIAVDNYRAVRHTG